MTFFSRTRVHCHALPYLLDAAAVWTVQALAAYGCTVVLLEPASQETVEAVRRPEWWRKHTADIDDIEAFANQSHM